MIQMTQLVLWLPGMRNLLPYRRHFLIALTSIVLAMLAFACTDDSDIPSVSTPEAGGTVPAPARPEVLAVWIRLGGVDGSDIRVTVNRDGTVLHQDGHAGDRTGRLAPTDLARLNQLAARTLPFSTIQAPGPDIVDGVTGGGALYGTGRQPATAADRKALDAMLEPLERDPSAALGR
jgi:hypothetical protein